LGQEQRRALQDKRSRLSGVEQNLNRNQALLRDFELRERSRLVQQERLRDECAELEKAASGREARVAELDSAFQELQAREQALRARVEQSSVQQQTHVEALRDKRRQAGEADQAVAGLKARLDVLRAQEAEKEDFPSGARVWWPDWTARRSWGPWPSSCARTKKHRPRSSRCCAPGWTRWCCATRADCWM
jgi:chromosome segregation ATPase